MVYKTVRVLLDHEIRMTARSRLVRSAVIPVLVLVLAACAGPEPEAQTVTILDDAFEPVEIVVKVGTEVTWVWEGEDEHDVSSAQFQSELQTNGTFTFTFDEPGTYAYACNPHRFPVFSESGELIRPAMTGFVQVIP